MNKIMIEISLLIFIVTTTNAADTWQFQKMDEVSFQIVCMTSSKLDPSTVYVGTIEGGMYRTYNAGKTWRPANAGADGNSVWDILVKRDDPYELFAVYRFGNHSRGLHHSYDGGNSWQILPDFLVMNALTIRQGEGNLLLAGIENKGVYKSTDNGITWATSNAGIEYYSPYLMNVFAGDPRRVLVGVTRFEQGYGLYQSINGGSAWVEQNQGLPRVFEYPPYPECILMDYNQPLIMYLGTTDNGLTLFHSPSTTFLYKSFSGGNDWTNLGRNIENKEIMSLAMDPSNPNIIYAGTKSDGLWASQNAGGMWAKIEMGAKPTQIKALQFAGEQSDALIVGAKEGLFVGNRVIAVGDDTNDDIICSPNPFTNANYIRYKAPNAGNVELRIYDMSGRLIRRINDEEVTAGWNLITWDGLNDAGDDVGSGVYFYQVRCDTAWASARVLKVNW
jgi:photosystem II stability/assembly factor-like uncharacterized protein